MVSGFTLGRSQSSCQMRGGRRLTKAMEEGRRWTRGGNGGQGIGGGRGVRGYWGEISRSDAV